MTQIKRKSKAINFDVQLDALNEQLGISADRAKTLRLAAKEMIEATEAKNPLYLIGSVSELATTEEELAFLMLNLVFWRSDKNAKKRHTQLLQTINEQNAEMQMMNARIGMYEGAMSLANHTLDKVQPLLDELIQRRQIDQHAQFIKPELGTGLTHLLPGEIYKNGRQFLGKAEEIELPEVDWMKVLANRSRELVLAGPSEFMYVQKMKKVSETLDRALQERLQPLSEFIADMHINLDTKQIFVRHSEAVESLCPGHKHQVAEEINEAISDALEYTIGIHGEL